MVYGGVGRDQVSFLRQADQFGLTDRIPTFLTPLEDLSFDQELGFDLIDGTYAMAAFWWNVDDENVQTYVEAYREEYGTPPGGYGVYLYNALNLIASAVEEGNDTPEAFREWMEGREVSLGQGDMTIRECDHQALIPIYILEGLAADEAESRGGDAEFGLREVVETVPGSEETAPTCEEVQQDSSGSADPALPVIVSHEEVVWISAAVAARPGDRQWRTPGAAGAGSQPDLRTAGVHQLAHGALYMVGAYLTSYLAVATGTIWLALLLVPMWR